MFKQGWQTESMLKLAGAVVRLLRDAAEMTAVDDGVCFTMFGDSIIRATDTHKRGFHGL